MHNSGLISDTHNDMRTLLLGLLAVSSLSIAAPPADRYDQAAFEKRFRTADKDKNGKLSRDEAYAEFPRAPQYFDEVDTNKDNFITLKEVNQAMKKRINAAMGSGQHLQGTDSTGPASATEAKPGAPRFSSKAEAKQQYRYDYYESLAGSLESAERRGEPAQPEPYPTLIKKSF